MYIKKYNNNSKIPKMLFGDIYKFFIIKIKLTLKNKIFVLKEARF